MMRFGVLGLAVSAIVMQAAAAQAESFADALASAYKTSNLLGQHQALLRAADEDVALAVGSLRPVLAFIAQASSSFQSATSGWLNQTNAGVQLRADMTLLDFGRGKAKVGAARELVLSTEQSLRAIEQQVLLSAAQAYINVTLQQEMVAMQQSNVRLITQDLRATQDRFDVGEVTRTDVSQAEAQLAAAKAQEAAAQGQLALAREAFRAAVGHYPDGLAALPPAPALPKTLAEAQAIATKSNPNIQAANHQSLAADFQVEGAKAETHPTLKAGTSATFGEVLKDEVKGIAAGTQQETVDATLTFSQTLYAGGQISAGYRKALAGQDAARSALQVTAVQTAQQVGNAWANLAVSAASISASDQQIAAAEAALDGVREEAAVGSRTTLDVLNAEQALLNAKAGRLQAVANQYLGKYNLLATMGLLTAEHLGLGVPLYDPEAYYNAVQSAPATSTRGAKLDKIMKLMGRD